MIVHIVLFEPRSDLTPADARQLLEAISAAAESIPGVRRMTVGRRIPGGSAYEAASDRLYQYAAIVEFDSIDGLRQYLAHPAHAALGARFHDALAGTVAADYDMTEATAAASLADDRTSR
jgi:hypothetical protein